MIGRVYHPDTWNCVDFAFAELNAAGIPTPDISEAKTAPGFFRTVRKHFIRAEWPPQENDFVVMVSMGRFHVGVWKNWRVKHCQDQVQSTDLGTIKTEFSKVEFLRYVPDHN